MKIFAGLIDFIPEKEKNSTNDNSNKINDTQSVQFYSESVHTGNHTQY